MNNIECKEGRWK